MEEHSAPFLGIDVSKATCDVTVHGSPDRWQFPRDEEGLALLQEQVRSLKPALAVLEATGGLEATVAAALAVVNARQPRDFARALGKLAKTDRIDAAVLAHFAFAVRPSPQALPDEAAQRLRALYERRQQLTEMLRSEQARLQTSPAFTRADVQEHVDWLKKRLTDTDKDLTDRIKNSPVWWEKDELLQSGPGVGKVLSFTILVALPESGHLSHKQITSLVGARRSTMTAARFAGGEASLEVVPRFALSSRHWTGVRCCLQKSACLLIDVSI